MCETRSSIPEMLETYQVQVFLYLKHDPGYGIKIWTFITSYGLATIDIVNNRVIVNQANQTALN